MCWASPCQHILPCMTRGGVTERLKDEQQCLPLQVALTRLATVEKEREDAVGRLQHTEGGSPAKAGPNTSKSPALQAALERVLIEQQKAADAARVAEQHWQQAAAHEHTAQVGAAAPSGLHD